MDQIVDNLSFIPGLNMTDDQFTEAQLQEAEVVVAEFIAARNINLDFIPSSSLYDMVIRPSARAYLQDKAQVQALQATMSMNGINTNPDVMSDAVVDAILSNIFLARRAGTYGRGYVRIDVSSLGTYSITTRMTFTTTSGIVFNPVKDTVALQSPTDPTTQTKIYPVDNTDGKQWYFSVEVQAVEQGVSGKLPAAVQLDAGTQIANLISVTTMGDFQGGEDSETNTELSARVMDGMTVKNRVSVRAITSAIKNQFQSVRQVAVAGMGSPVQSRDATNILGIGRGGFADIYTRTAEGASVLSIQKTALLVSEVLVDGVYNTTYEVVIGRDDAPGHYFLKAIIPAGQNVISSYAISSESRSYNMVVQDPVTGLMTIPNRARNIIEAAYTRYMSTTVQFIARAASPGASTIDVNLLVYVQPLISEIQDFINDTQEKVAVADYLVRAFVPCFVSLSEIFVYATSAQSIESLRTQVYSYINNIAPGQAVQADSIVKVLRAVEGVSRVKLPITMSGTIYAPDGSQIEISNEDQLQAPTQTDIKVSPDTVAFFIEVNSIPITVLQI